MALITITDLNNIIGESDTTAAKTSAVNGAIGYVEDYCKRTFLSTTYRKWYNVSGNTLKLDHYPVIQLQRVMSGLKDCLRISYSAAGATSAQVAVAGSVMVLTQLDSGVIKNTSISLTGCDSMDEVKTTIETNAGWSAEVINEEDPASIMSTSSSDALSAYATVQCPDDAIESSMTDYTAGIVTLEYALKQNPVYVEYLAGYVYGAIPDGLTRITAEIAVALYQAGKRDGSITGEKIGDYSWTSAQTNASDGVLKPFESRLNKYRNISL